MGFYYLQALGYAGNPFRHHDHGLLSFTSNLDIELRHQAAVTMRFYFHKHWGVQPAHLYIYEYALLSFTTFWVLS